MRAKTFVILLAVLILGACNQQENEITEKPGRSWHYETYPNKFPDHPLVDGTPGRFGEPPRSVKELNPPIQLVNSGMWLDDGTLFAHMRDMDGNEASLCVAQREWGSNIPPKTLYVGALHPSSKSARLPLTQAEAIMLSRSLKDALKPLENQKDEIYCRSELPSNEEYNLLYAFEMLSDLSKINEFSLADVEKIEKRILELSNVDIELLGEIFRTSEGPAKAAAWQKLEPVLLGHIKTDPKIDPIEFVKNLLGEPETDSPEELAGKMVYVLSTTGNSTVYLVFDVNDRSRIGINCIRVTSPN